MTDTDFRRYGQAAFVALIVAVSMLTGHFATRVLWKVVEPAVAVESPPPIEPKTAAPAPELFAYQQPELAGEEAAYSACYDEADVQISWREFYQKTVAPRPHQTQWLDLRIMSRGEPMNAENLPTGYKNFSPHDWCKLALATVKAMGPSDAAEFRSVHEKKRHVERVAIISSEMAWAPTRSMIIQYRMRTNRPVCESKFSFSVASRDAHKKYSWEDCHREASHPHIYTVTWLKATPLAWEDTTPPPAKQ